MSAVSAMSGFLRWWGGELAALVPGAIRRAFAVERPLLLAQARDGRIALALRDDGRSTPLGALDALPPARRRALARDVRRGAMRVALTVAQGEAATRRVTLPIVAEADLSAALALDMDRLSPFAAEELYWGWRLVERAPEQGRIVVEVAFTPRAGCGAALATLSAAALPAQSVIGLDAEGGQAGPVMRGPELAPERGRSWGRRAAGLGLAALALLALWHAGVAHWRLSAEVAALRQAVQAARAARFDDEAAAADPLAAQVGEMRAARPLAVATLDALSATLPDDAWVERLTLSPDGVLIRGEAAEAARLIPLLDGAPAFEDPRFTAPLQRIGGGARERFAISLSPAAAEDGR